MEDINESIAECDTDTAKKKLVKETRSLMDKTEEILSKFNPRLMKDADASKDKILPPR